MHVCILPSNAVWLQRVGSSDVDDHSPAIQLTICP